MGMPRYNYKKQNTRGIISFRLHWSLDINQYGSTTQITGTSNGDYDVEYFTLKYDRD